MGHVNLLHVAIEDVVLLVLCAGTELLVASLVDEEWIPVEVLVLFADHFDGLCLRLDRAVARLVWLIHCQVRVSEVPP